MEVNEDLDVNFDFDFDFECLVSWFWVKMSCGMPFERVVAESISTRSHL